MLAGLGFLKKEWLDDTVLKPPHAPENPAQFGIPKWLFVTKLPFNENKPFISRLPLKPGLG